MTNHPNLYIIRIVNHPNLYVLMLFTRKIQKNIEKLLFKKKIIIIYGPRQVGKTTLLKVLQKKFPHKKSLFLNCDFLNTRTELQTILAGENLSLFKNYKMIYIDEAQRVENIGLILKIAIDHFPDKQFIVTGSSSFDLSNKINEPLTGRKYEFHLYPLSLEEIWSNKNKLEKQSLLKQYLTYGLYPDIVNHPELAVENLSAIVNGTLYKDVLEHQTVKHSDLLQKLLQALAFQIGQEVSYNELSNLLKTNKETIRRYIHLLEESFIIFRLKPYSKNLRHELKKMQKIYFFDLGIRNALINQYAQIEIRNDIGALWENFLIVERMKYNHYNQQNLKSYFWRTHQQQELDYIEEKNMQLSAFEFKWNSNKKAKAPKAFLDTYPDANFKLINKDNYEEFVMP